MYEPTVRVVCLLQVLCVLSFLIAPVPAFFSFLAINILLLLLHSPKFRQRFVSLIKLGIVWAFFLFVVGMGRVMGGTSARIVWQESVQRLEFLSSITFIMTLAYLYIKPEDYLRIFDRVKMPREISYIFLSVISLIDYVRNIGQRQLHLLTIKGLNPTGIAQRVRAYYRILGPLFSVLLSRQVVHSRSVFYRGFYDDRSKVNSTYVKLKSGERRWTAMALFNFALCLLISLWLSK